MVNMKNQEKYRQFIAQKCIENAVNKAKNRKNLGENLAMIFFIQNQNNRSSATF